MELISLRLATNEDLAIVVAFDIAVDTGDQISSKRMKKVVKAISNEECYIILANKIAVGFLIFDYRFFDQGWIELIIIEKKHRGKGLAGQVFELICKRSHSSKVFTSTNDSNIQMQKALIKAGFTFAGKLEGLDDGDPELFYYRLK